MREKVPHSPPPVHAEAAHAFRKYMGVRDWNAAEAITDKTLSSSDFHSSFSTHYVVQDSLKLIAIFLLQSLKCWDYHACLSGYNKLQCGECQPESACSTTYNCVTWDK